MVLRAGEDLDAGTGTQFVLVTVDEYNIPLTPATGKSTFSFEFMAHSSMKDNIINHKNGQSSLRFFLKLFYFL